jgi:SAM-dependent methyltransferase
MGNAGNSRTNIGMRRRAAGLGIAAGGVLASLPIARRLVARRRSAEGPRWYQVVYRLIYRVGFTPWQRATPYADLVAVVEGPSALRPGRALDLGCGTGTDTVYLATHGWDVTAVDMTPAALAAARRNATGAGVSPRFIQGDVTRLHELGVGDGYSLLLDFGCFHTLPEDRRPAYVSEVSRAAAPGATLLLFGFRRPIAPMHAGITADEVPQRFSDAGWQLVSAERASAEAMHLPRAAERFELWRYQLRRTSPP